tara:strand:+ start:175 stop:783 length:609 start_codon:yes stop_codon:yes gene_type:complete
MNAEDNDCPVEGCRLRAGGVKATTPPYSETTTRNFMTGNRVLSQFISYSWIAGGAILSHLMKTPVKDFDIFFRSKNLRDKEVEDLLLAGGKYIKKLRLGHSVQLGKMKYDLLHLGTTPQETIEFFDYTVCSIAIDAVGETYKHPNFDEHFEKRKLVYTGAYDKWFSDMPETANLNVLKARRLAAYLKKGFDIDDDNIRAIFK